MPKPSQKKTKKVQKTSGNTDGMPEEIIDFLDSHDVKQDLNEADSDLRNAFQTFE